MSARNLFSTLAVLTFIGSAQGAWSADEKLPLSAEEVTNKRRAVREELMLPSLTGIKSLAYRVVGFKDYAPLEKVMASKLAQLNIPCEALVKIAGKKGSDALVQISFSKVSQHTIGELKVFQWAALERNPKTVVRAVTYSDKIYTTEKPEQAVEQLTNNFVVDYLKANQAGFAGAKPASSSEKPAVKKSK